MNILKLLRNALVKEEKMTEQSHSRERISSRELTESFIANPDFPFLVSFSRTGSHWLRMLMELYFQKPSLKLLFFQTVKETKEYTCFHTHDLDLKVQRKNVVYLYRDPVDTIFSQMAFYSQTPEDKTLMDGWVDLYAKHLHKWLLNDNFTQKKVILTYEGMKKDLSAEFKKLAPFFDTPFDEKRLKAAASQVSKEKIKEKTGHNPKVINLSKDYPDMREEFRKKYGEYIYGRTYSMYPELKTLFNPANGNH